MNLRTLKAALIMLAVLVTLPVTAGACSCRREPLLAVYKRSAQVFVAEVVKVRKSRSRPRHEDTVTYEAVLKNRQSIKGHGPATITLKYETLRNPTMVDGVETITVGGCYMDYAVGREYVILTNPGDSLDWHDWCSSRIHSHDRVTLEDLERLRDWDKLAGMGAADQAVREKLGPLLAKADFQSEEFRAVAQEMDAVDARNLAELQAMVARHGWPRADETDRDSSNAAFLILQHSPLTAQKELLPKFRDAVTAGQARGDQLAMLEDRILTREGHKQRYGTQISMGQDETPRVSPVEDPANLDARRKSVGLPPMKEYLDRAAADLGRPIDTSALSDE